jgi:glycosyltransferase involved in cell wall biosynthesis
MAVRSTDAPLAGQAAAEVWLANAHRGDPQVNVPTVAVVHEVGWGTAELDSYFDPRFVERMSMQTKAGVGQATLLIAPSHSSKQQIISAYGCPAGKVHVVPYGVDHAVFRPTAASPGSVTDRLRRSNTPYVLFFGSLSRRKNLAAVRKAVAQMAAEGFPHVLVIVASPPPDGTDSSDLEREALTELPGTPGRLIHVRTPSDREVAELMSGAAAVCHPSYAEGFGLTALEAMACGAPVIVSNRGALPEVVGKAGLVVEPTDDAVREALIRLVREPALAGRLRAGGLHRASQLSWERVAAGWLRVLARAAAASR